MDILAVALNTAAALVMGLVIGVERQFRQRTAGLRTNTLVCVGAALFVSVARGLDPASSTRVAAQVVSGIGFLGGGVILREGLSVRGMNTAATLWCSAAVGTLAGLGLLAQAAVGTVAVLCIHLALRPLVRMIDAHTRTAVEVETLYRIRVTCASQMEAVIRAICSRHVNSQPHMTLHGIATEDTEQGQQTTVVADIFSAERNDKFMNELVSRIGIEPNVSAVSWERLS